MSLDIELFVYNTSRYTIAELVEDRKLGILSGNIEFSIAGFVFRFIPLSEKDTRLKTTTRLCCSTGMGMSNKGSLRGYQRDICHLLAQNIAMYLNTEVEVEEEDRTTNYRRTDYPEVHEVLDGRKHSISFECPNFCQILECGSNEWKTM